jgi:hypothetical protein
MVKIAVKAPQLMIHANRSKFFTFFMTISIGIIYPNI